MQSKNNALNEEKEREKYLEELVEEVKNDFLSRQQERLKIERGWELNMNFLSGNQYCNINFKGEITEEDKEFYWQSKNVYNHIAPIIESRLAKFSKVSPRIAVRPKTDDDKENIQARKAEKLIEEVFTKGTIQEVCRSVTSWSETCGTGFYKILWNDNGGNKIGEVNGKNIFEGEVEIVAVSPFEIFPDSLSAEKVSDLKSIIHAKAVPVSEIKRKYGVQVVGEDVSVYNLNGYKKGDKKSQSVLKNSAIVIEKYERASEEFPNGRIITIAGDKLLYYGELPYINGKNGERVFPFVKQDSCVLPGSFFGKSVIERLIPVQRAFNAVKNRKHEFLNRLSMGVLTVEDGSVDVDDLSSDGLEPGKVLVYRQGSTPPEMMEKIDMPTSFDLEEEKLLNEFVIISGVSDVVSSSENSKVSSGTALQILVEQDNERLTMVAERIRNAYLDVARQILRLYATFIKGVKIVKSIGDNGKVKMYYLDKSVAYSDDLYLASENELQYTEQKKREMVFKLFESGLLNDENGKIRLSVKEKVLELLGHKELDYNSGISRLQEEKAVKENQKLKTDCVKVDEIDDNEIHIAEHTRFVLSEYETLSETERARYLEHIAKHKEKIKTAI